MGKLTVIGLNKARPGRHNDGSGLYLLVKPSGARSWLLRVQHCGRRRDIGLGSVERSSRPSYGEREIEPLRSRVLTLAQAREKSAILRKLALAGFDPVTERDRGKVHIPTFAEAIELAHAELKKGWEAKYAARFKACLVTHAAPTLGQVRVDEINAGMVTATLAKIWHRMPATAKKLRESIIQVLAFCQANNWRTDDPPSIKVLKKGLAKPKKAKHFAAMPYREVPGFVRDLRDKPQAMSRLALAFIIATAARTIEVRSATWEMIDLEEQMWKRPAEIMKGNSAHSIPLNALALTILEEARAFGSGQGLIFPGRRGEPLSHMTPSKVLHAQGRKDVTVHGFRSSFRDWAAEKMPHIPSGVVELSLAHTEGNATEQAYLRSDLLQLRRNLMQEWDGYLSSYVDTA